MMRIYLWVLFIILLIVISLGSEPNKPESNYIIHLVINSGGMRGSSLKAYVIEIEEGKEFNISLDELSMLSLNSTKKVTLSNICAVFAQSEIINMISKGVSMEDIVKAANISIISRIFGMLQRIGVEDEVMFCGGVAKNRGMAHTLQEKLNRKIFLPEYVDFVGAFGAALFATNL